LVPGAVVATTGEILIEVTDALGDDLAMPTHPEVPIRMGARKSRIT
jgi:hypothetical protein